MIAWDPGKNRAITARFPGYLVLISTSLQDAEQNIGRPRPTAERADCGRQNLGSLRARRRRAPDTSRPGGGSASPEAHVRQRPGRDEPCALVIGRGDGLGLGVSHGGSMACRPSGRRELKKASPHLILEAQDAPDASALGTAVSRHADMRVADFREEGLVGGDDRLTTHAHLGARGEMVPCLGPRPSFRPQAPGSPLPDADGQRVLDRVAEGTNVVVLGAPGTGKTSAGPETGRGGRRWSGRRPARPHPRACGPALLRRAAHLRERPRRRRCAGAHPAALALTILTTSLTERPDPTASGHSWPVRRTARPGLRSAPSVGRGSPPRRPAPGPSAPNCATFTARAEARHRRQAGRPGATARRVPI